MNIQVYEERGALATLAPAWRELAAQDPAATIFQSPEYAWVWWEEFGALRSLALAEIHDEAAVLLGIAPLSMEPDGVVHFVGDPAVTDYLAPVSRPHDRDRVATAIIEVATGLAGFTGLSLSALPADTGWNDALSRAAKAAGLVVIEDTIDVCPVAQIDGSWEGYLSSLSGKQRHEIRRKARRLQEHGGYAVRLSGTASIDEDLDAFFALHRSSDGPKGKFMHENMATYFRRLAHTMLDGGRLRLAMMELAGVPVAGLFGFSDGATWSIYNSAYDHARRELSPGMVLVADTIKLAAEEGCSRYDFLRGAEEYKYRFGAVDRQIVTVTASPHLGTGSI